MIPVRERGQLLTETRTKIVNEIAGPFEARQLVQPAGKPPKTDCDTSESLWDDIAPTPHTPETNTGQKL